MEDRESGSLSRKPALDLLVELHRGAVTGSLKLERAPLQKAVYFRDGQILFAASNDPKDQLASILVEEGKLGPDQMQVAQARVSPGNPLAKVLTELGYISQRELADAARVKVEKILTDLYTWKEGSYQFATKSLPKGAIDLELSTSRLLFASIRRVQERDWILRQLGSLETVLTPTASLPQFTSDSQPEPLAAEVLGLADGVKTIKQIGAVSSLGEFEVCKVLAAALVVGAVSKEGAAPVVAGADDAFSYPRVQESFSFASPPETGIGSETIVAPPPDPAPQEPMSYDTIFQAAVVKPPPPVEEPEATIFEPAPLPKEAPGRIAPRINDLEPPKPPPVSELLIEEPEPASEAPHGRVAPRPRKKKQGSAAISPSAGPLKWAGAALLAGAAGFSVYYFVVPLIAGGGSAPSSSAATSTAPSAPPVESTTSVSAPPLPSGSAAASPATPPGTSTHSAPPSGVPTPPLPRAATTPDPRASNPPSGAPRPPSTSGSRDGRDLLRSGNLGAAARAFQKEIESAGPDRFTVALGLYCNEDNVGRLVNGAGDSSQVYVLPASVDGRSCYRVIWGLYDSLDAAERSIGSLPGGLRSGDAAAVAVSRFLR